MIVFTILLFVATLWIWGVRCVTSEGFIFEKFGTWWESAVPEWIYKPTIGCAACMSSVHGSLWYWTWGKVLLPPVDLWLTLVLWVMFCICLCGLNFILLEKLYRNESE
jgi:hypothetical protein